MNTPLTKAPNIRGNPQTLFCLLEGLLVLCTDEQIKVPAAVTNASLEEKDWLL